MERAASSHSMLIPTDPMICTELPDPHGARHRRSQRSGRISEWFPKAEGLWRVQGGALALLSWNGHQRGRCLLSNEPAPAGDDGTKYCRDSGLVQPFICVGNNYVAALHRGLDFSAAGRLGRHII